MKDHIHRSFLTNRMVSVGRHFLPEVLGQTDPVGAKTPIFNRYSLVAHQPKHLPKSQMNTNRNALSNEPKMNVVRCHPKPPVEAQQSKTAVFRVKLHFT